MSTPKTPIATTSQANRIDPVSLSNAELHSQLHRVLATSEDEAEVRKLFRAVITEHVAAVGIGHVIRERDDSWDLPPGYSTGRVPRRQDFIEQFGRCCQRATDRDTVQIEHFLGLEAIYAPVSVVGAAPEVLLVLCERKDSSRALHVVEIAQAYFSFWLKDCRAKRNDWKLTSLAALVELVSEIEMRETRAEACQVAASELARYLDTPHVAIATRDRRGKLIVSAISGTDELDANSEKYQTLLAALNECCLRDEIATYPTEADESFHLLVGHQLVSQDFRVEAVVSSPLRLNDGKQIGAILLTGDVDDIRGDRLPNFLRASAPRIASAIDVVTRGELNHFRRRLKPLAEFASRYSTKVWWALAVAIVGIMFLPVTYRVRCSGTLEATERRYAVAPFGGLVEKGFVRPGDTVTKGQVLAQMDGQALRFELASVTAEREQAAKRREVELTARNIPQSLLADLDRKKLDARKNLLSYQLDQIEVRSPVDGVVLNGSLEKAEAAAVEMGQVLFEVGPLQPLRLEVTVPSDEVTHVKAGQEVTVRIEGFESRPIDLVVERIRPLSELRDQQNVFVAECLVMNDDAHLRPGMSGRVRIDTERKSLAWTLFHKPYYYLVSRLSWW